MGVGVGDGSGVGVGVMLGVGVGGKGVGEGRGVFVAAGCVGVREGSTLESHAAPRLGVEPGVRPDAALPATGVASNLAIAESGA